MIDAKLKAICEALNAAQEDAGKFDKGNASAGTRVRGAAMQAIKDLKALRIAVQEKKNS